MDTKVKALLIECSDIMLNGIMHNMSHSDNIQITGKVSRFNSIPNFTSTDEDEIILIGPMFCDIYGADACNEIISKFPGKKTLALNYEDYPSRIVEKIKEFETGVSV